MYISFDHYNELTSAIQKEPLSTNEYWLILLSDKHQPQLEEIITHLDNLGIRFFGAIFPGLIHGKRMLNSGAIIRKVRCLSPPTLISLPTNQSDIKKNLPAYKDIPETGSTCLTFIDCLSTGIDDFLHHVYNRYNQRCSYFGAGAGNNDVTLGHAVFGNWGCESHSAVIAIIDQTSSCIAQHGWERHRGPFVASRTTGNVVHELDWEDAETAYRDALPEKLRATPPDRFYKDVTPRYPFAVEHPGSEDVVRDPISLCGNGDVMFLSDIPQGALLYMVKGSPEQLISAASKAVTEAMEKKSSHILVCDCLSRTAALGHQFPTELREVSEKVSAAQDDVTVEGVIALGEIASNGEKATNFYNKTFGICSFHD
ncbi:MULTISPECIES: FIST C-terminal domain-containing protein [unclassified Neptuniibacter]|uniref:FIST signal transduction protein n=1 Tax=unclassified Neptuniibacter TaxID=2630693 RepID=UPI0025F4EE60|nr:MULTISPECIES: FIST C-terminal domain-containing protein [unclassified Neptuniibacter]|tara:strand:+ start:4572 stop:5681 length:1110 start_codon:yes stop_codon:yes gene_type:complete